MMSEPTDIKLYEKVKKRIYEQIPKHSAYRSGHLVQEYKTAFAKKYGSSKNPYKNKKPDPKVGLQRWFLEDWKNQNNEVGYNKKGDYYRPNRRITAKTPITHDELSEKQRKRASRKKANGERASFT
tara:strand:+ start:2478 stop:2855 length:378 start_codon:yes stop_codon:yes gene_type:complete